MTVAAPLQYVFTRRSFADQHCLIKHPQVAACMLSATASSNECAACCLLHIAHRSGTEDQHAEGKPTSKDGVCHLDLHMLFAGHAFPFHVPLVLLTCKFSTRPLCLPCHSFILRLFLYYISLSLSLSINLASFSLFIFWFLGRQLCVGLFCPCFLFCLSWLWRRMAASLAPSILPVQQITPAMLQSASYQIVPVHPPLLQEAYLR